jgi:hypothetical protein
MVFTLPAANDGVFCFLEVAQLAHVFFSKGGDIQEGYLRFWGRDCKT